MCSLIKRWMEEHDTAIIDNMQSQYEEEEYQDYINSKYKDAIECTSKTTDICCNDANCPDCNTKFKTNDL